MPNSLKALSLAALLCLPAAALALFMAWAWWVGWNEDVAKTFMSETPGYTAPASERAFAYLRALPALCLYVAPIVFGALLPVAVICVANLLGSRPSLAVRRPGPMLFMFLVVCSSGAAWIGILSQPVGFAVLPLSAFAVLASFIPFVPHSTHDSKVP